MATRGGMRASAVVREAAKSADPFKYHSGAASPFWEKFRKAMVVNPDSNTGILTSDNYRWPPPGSRPEKYSLPPSRASDPAQNSYFERDFRRRYPRLDVITQNDLSALLLAQPQQLNLPAPSTQSGVQAAEGTTDVTTVPSPTPSLSSLYLAPAQETAAAAKSFFSAGKLPPVPASGIKLSWSPAQDKVVRDPYSYFPMDNYSSKVVEQNRAFGHDSERTNL